MRKLVTTLLATSVLVLLPGLTLGNGPPPPKAWRFLYQPDPTFKEEEAKSKALRLDYSVPMKVIYRHEARAKIVVPRKYAVEGNAEAKPGAFNEPAQIDGEPSRRTMIAGLALSAALVGGGLWFVRRSWSNARKATMAVILFGCLAASPLVPLLWSNSPAPPRPDAKKTRPAQQTQFEAEQTVRQSIDIEIVEDGDAILLVLPKSLLPAQLLPRDMLVPIGAAEFDREIFGTKSEEKKK